MTVSCVIGEDRSALMVGEAHHRFYNGLQVIISATNSILRDGVQDSRVRERLAALQDRVAQLADINRRLSGPFGPESVSRSALNQLCAALAASFDRSGISIEVEVRGLVQSPETCRVVLLLTGELMTNALKHGASDMKLWVFISLVAANERCCLRVLSNTPGRAGAKPPRIAAELVAAAGGLLETCTENGEFAARVVLPDAAHGGPVLEQVGWICD